MLPITDEKTFKQALSNLAISQQRMIGALFVESVLQLFDDDRVKRALKVAQNLNASEDELQNVYKSARSASIESFTRCGADGDWKEQAGHFVANAAAACVIPSEQIHKNNPAWEAAMNSRMARSCEAIANGETSNEEDQHQYRVLSEFLTQ
jgi:hypothetical protein